MPKTEQDGIYYERLMSRIERDRLPDDVDDDGGKLLIIQQEHSESEYWGNISRISKERVARRVANANTKGNGDEEE